MARLPEPLTPPGCDLGGNDWFPLHFDRLRKSSWWRRATDLARARNVMLWGEAYKSVPAGSLPDDDDELAEAAGFGFDVEYWLANKSEILAPWVMCSDGRWYHPTVAEIALDAWGRVSEKRRADRIRKALQREAVRPKKQVVPCDIGNVPPDRPQKSVGQTAHDRTGQDTTGNQFSQEEAQASKVSAVADVIPMTGRVA
jgi:hypothetical protein